MRSIFIRILFSSLLILAVGGCQRAERNIPLHRWSSMTPTFDSLTDQMERSYMNFDRPEIFLHHLVAMDSCKTRVEGKKRNTMEARARMWRSRYHYRFGSKDSAINLIEEAMALTDSTEMPYDWMRMKTHLYLLSDSITGADQFRHYEEAIEYADKLKDPIWKGHVAILMGNLMNQIGEQEIALNYLSEADEIFTQFGFWKIPVKDSINRAGVYESMGQKDKADSILKSLIGHPALAEDTFAMNLIPRNLFARERSDIKYLEEAYDQIKDNPRYRYLRGLFSSLKTEYYVRNNQLDSAYYYGDRMMEDLPYVSDYGHKGMILFNRGLLFSMQGQIDSALYYRVSFEYWIDQMHLQERTNEVLRLSTLKELKAREMRYSLEITRRNWIIALVAVSLLAGEVVTVLVLNRRHMRQRMRSMANELELEKAKRKMAATAITIEEKDNMLDTLRNELSEMRKEGEIREGSARRLESTIKTHLREHEHEETFRNMFDTVNPGFTDRLRQYSPDLAESYIKLACYLLMDLDNKKIATLMMIKPESVRQARWRLRQRLHISEGTTLEEFLRQLNSP